MAATADAARATEAKVLAALGEVRDPCSLGRGVPASVVDMGMVCGLEVVPRPHGRARVIITMRLTSPGCTFQLYFDDRLRASLRAIDEVDEVDIVWSDRFDWSDEDMSDGLKARVRARREILLRDQSQRLIRSPSI